MNYKPLIYLAALTVLNYGCSKKNNPTPTSNNLVNITWISGNNQTGQVGYPLSDSIYIQVKSNNAPAVNYTVQFIGSGCNEDLITNTTTKSDGFASYSWILAGNSGAQSLRAVVIHNGKRIDSTTLNATAYTQLLMPARSACVPPIVISDNVAISGYAEQFIALTTGRLFACFASATSVRYSDDNGVSWNAVKGLGATHFVTQLAVTGQNGVFAATSTDGLYYSGDGGNTWANVSPPGLNNAGGIADMTYTNSGKLIVFSAPNNFYITTNNGSSWTSLTATGLTPTSTYIDLSELNNGDLYMVDAYSFMCKSTDGGQNWIKLVNPQNISVYSIYCDNKGWFYKAVADYTTPSTIIYVSKDNGTTFSALAGYLVSTNQPWIYSMSVQPDGQFYFVDYGYAIVQLGSGGTITNVTTDEKGIPAPYVATKNQAFVYANSQGMFILYP